MIAFELRLTLYFPHLYFISSYTMCWEDRLAVRIVLMLNLI